MENTNKDAAQEAALQNDWQNAEKEASLNVDPSNTKNNDLRSAEASGYDGTDEDDRLYVTGDADEADKESEEETSDNEETEAGDWGNVDPAENNSPFPDSNDPSGPGSAV